MKKLVVTLFAIVVAGSTFLGLCTDSAQSRPQYLKSFRSMYVKPDSPDGQAFSALVTEAKCAVCHEPGNDRKLRNRYGKELAKAFEAENEKNVKDVTKIDAALKKVADMHVDPNDQKSPTYDELIKQGKLPGGDPSTGENK
ncbi:MAG TPA: hypothetical protein VGJ04_01275 [Pirellulales bacterium]|jgi:hypothetical protein